MSKLCIIILFNIQCGTGLLLVLPIHVDCTMYSTIRQTVMAKTSVLHLMIIYIPKYWDDWCGL